MSRALPVLPAGPRRLLQALVAVGLLAILWRAADGEAALRSLLQAEPGWLVLALLALTVQMGLSALRWRLTAGRLGIALTARRAVAEYYIAQVVNQSLPGGVLGDAGRAVRSRHGAGLVSATEAVIFERLAGQVALLAVLAVAFAATLAVPGGLDWPRWLALAVASGLAVTALLPGVALGVARLPGAVGRGTRAAGAALGTALLDRAVLPGQVALSLGTAIANLAAFAFCARAVGVDLSLPAIAALVPLILLTMLIPITISGWGLREGAAAALLPVAGATASGGLAASVAFGLCAIVSVLPGLVMVWLAPGGPDAEGAEAEGPDTRHHDARRPAGTPMDGTPPNGTIRRGGSACNLRRAD